MTLIEPPCYGSDYNRCLEAETELESIASPSCDGSGPRVCLVPLGRVSPGLVQNLVAYFQNEYGLTVLVLNPSAIPGELADPEREQIDGVTLIQYVGSLFPPAFDDPNAVLIGLTPVDLYDRQTSNFRFVFGMKGTPAIPKAVMSTFRMNPETFGDAPDDNLLFARARKFFSRYIGLLFYGLSTSQDRTSLLYDSVLGLDDIDRMEERLPITPAP